MASDAATLSQGWGYGSEPAADPAAWRAARQHSRLVSTLRLALPGLAFVVVAWMYLSARTLPSGIGDIDLGDVGLDGTTLTMQNPSLSGFNEDGTAYNVAAAKAMQDVTDPRTVTLKFVDGTMTKPDGSKVRVTADDGVYDSEKQFLTLDNNIVVVTDNNERAFLQAADIDMKAGTIASDKPVRAKGKNGSISAKSMEIADSGAHLLFKGDVVVHLRLDGGPVDEKAADGKPANGQADAAAENTASEATPDDGQ